MLVRLTLFVIVVCVAITDINAFDRIKGKYVTGHGFAGKRRSSTVQKRPKGRGTVDIRGPTGPVEINCDQNAPDHVQITGPTGPVSINAKCTPKGSNNPTVTTGPTVSTGSTIKTGQTNQTGPVEQTGPNENNETASVNDLRAKLDDLLEKINNKRFGNVEESLLKLSETASKTWIAVKTFIINTNVSLSSNAKTDQNKYLADIDSLMKNLLAAKYRYELTLEAVNQATNRSKFNNESVVSAVNVGITHLDTIVDEITQIKNKINAGLVDNSLTEKKTGSEPESVDYWENSKDGTADPVRSDLADDVHTLVSLFSLNLNNKRVAKIETIVINLKKLISILVKSANKPVAEIITKLKGENQMKSSEKLRLLTKITTVLNTLVDLKAKIESVLNAAVKSISKPSNAPHKKKAATVLVTLRAQIIYLNLEIAQVYQLQINLIGGVSEDPSGTVTEHSEIPNDKSPAVKTKTGQLTPQTTAVKSLQVKVDDLLTNLKSKKFNKIGTIVTELNVTSTQTWITVTKFLQKIRIRLKSGTKMADNDKHKCLDDITALLKSLLIIKIKYVLVLKTTNEASTRANGSDKTILDQIMSSFSAQMIQIDTRVTEILKIQYELNEGTPYPSENQSEILVNRNSQPSSKSINVRSKKKPKKKKKN